MTAVAKKEINTWETQRVAVSLDFSSWITVYSRVGQKKIHPLDFFLFALIFFAMFENPEKFKIWLS
jgi:hypothetical protein